MPSTESDAEKQVEWLVALLATASKFVMRRDFTVTGVGGGGDATSREACD